MNKKLDELINLRQENPDLEVIFMVPEETGETGDQFQYWRADISEIKKGLFCIYGPYERIYWDEDELKEDLENDLHPEIEMSEEEIDQFVEDQYNLLDRKEVIYVLFDV